MNLRFYRRMHVAPGIRLNFGTRGTSVSFGRRGAWYTVGKHGRRSATLGWPGTGVRYTVIKGVKRIGPLRERAPSAFVTAWIAAAALLVSIISHL